MLAILISATVCVYFLRLNTCLSNSFLFIAIMIAIHEFNGRLGGGGWRGQPPLPTRADSETGPLPGLAGELHYTSHPRPGLLHCNSPLTQPGLLSSLLLLHYCCYIIYCIYKIIFYYQVIGLVPFSTWHLITSCLPARSARSWIMNVAKWGTTILYNTTKKFISLYDAPLL